MATPEAKVKRDIKRELDGRGFWRAGAARPDGPITGWYYMPVPNGLGVHGIPDFVGCYLGKFFSIEAKAPGGAPTANQERRHQEIDEAGGIILVVDGVDRLKEWFDAR